MGGLCKGDSAEEILRRKFCEQGILQAGFLPASAKSPRPDPLASIPVPVVKPVNRIARSDFGTCSFEAFA